MTTIETTLLVKSYNIYEAFLSITIMLVYWIMICHLWFINCINSMLALYFVHLYVIYGFVRENKISPNFVIYILQLKRLSYWLLIKASNQHLEPPQETPPGIL